MKKLFILLIPVLILFSSCVSTGFPENNVKVFEPEFESTYDNATGNTFTFENHIKNKVILRKNGEVEKLTMRILETEKGYKALQFIWIYEANDWLFNNEIRFYDNNKNRYYLKAINNETDVTSDAKIWEWNIAILSEADITALKNYCESEEDFYCTYIGKQYRSNETTINSKMKKAILAIIDKYESMK